MDVISIFVLCRDSDRTSMDQVLEGGELLLSFAALGFGGRNPMDVPVAGRRPWFRRDSGSCLRRRNPSLQRRRQCSERMIFFTKLA